MRQINTVRSACQKGTLLSRTFSPSKLVRCSQQRLGFCDNPNCVWGGENTGIEVPFRLFEAKKNRLPICVGVVIRRHRERRKLTIQKLAAISGFYCKFIKEVESASTDAYVWQLRKISKALGITFERVLKQAGREAQVDTGLLRIMRRLAAQHPTRRDAA